MRLLSEKPWFIAVAIAGVIAGALLVASFSRTTDRSILCSLGGGGSGGSFFRSAASPVAQLQLDAILHYATSHDVPQQSINEIRISFNVLKKRSPCNFLVFGLGLDSIMWSSFNPGGTTLFLEEDPKWYQAVLKNAPFLNAHAVRYRTQLSQADDLLKTYRKEPACMPPNVELRGNDQCKLALSFLPQEVYDKEWDLIMIDAPKGYYNEAPGRMAAIFSAAVMARNRKGKGPTHVFLHDVNRRVEKTFAEEFLCRKNRVGAVERLWHFQIPPTNNSTGFC
eukprot:TRINITY_DN19789_c0_g1_i1.p1 TRINITY_DN19789_c0_g1~~TRINITY_DN19789_c0_g1_i1.p1  ORF type:complete len:280 (+),score=13.33 TRINITY_DN19789_c0_g1_i1:72-911(+)